jgi:hypothetical protein
MGQLTYLLLLNSFPMFLYLIKVIRKAPPSYNFKRFLFYVLYILPLHVSALIGHLQAEYTIISGTTSYNGSVVLCYYVLFYTLGKFCRCLLNVLCELSKRLQITTLQLQLNFFFLFITISFTTTCDDLCSTWRWPVGAETWSGERDCNK